MKKKIYIGCSSFYNGYWKEVFYPKELPSKQWFEYYCQHFDTFEINATFYKFPTLKIMQNWFDRTPDNFLLSVKAPKLITHIQKFNDCESLLEDFYGRCAEGLKHKLGCVLFQLPPSYHYSRERLDHMVSQLDLKFKNVIEFRHESWWITEVWNELVKNNITLCSVSHPSLPETIFIESPLIYVRLHGTPKMFYSDYDTDYLKKLKEVISKNNPAKGAFVYFNNTASTAGILNALEMKKLF
ncbi:MAG: DUF72 domain-containing protein [Flavobacterium sp. JAD_PAG50586_2]|nr:MAG: DUF72 domain-containing protein [Flavobacterium sp. JAD_PAG50586_2]